MIVLSHQSLPWIFHDLFRMSVLGNWVGVSKVWYMFQEYWQ